MSEDRLEQILARRDAAKKEIVNVDEPSVKLVIFMLGRDLFAFHGERIREILSNAEIFFVPGCPHSLEGVINVRGDIESVIGLHEILQLPQTDKAGQSAILLGRTSEMSSGVRVGPVIDVVDMPQSLLQPPPSNLPDNIRPFVSALLNFREQAVTVLDLDHIFATYLKALG